LSIHKIDLRQKQINFIK